ncbi:ASCH domain-containing protein [Microbulbifer sp. ZKSA006]|uniref:ASCH domain-containing protein n=1 Tax=Microbulbifer sp. ZKSA006 TaxID=3243390 RepID=UPI00403A06C1
MKVLLSIKPEFVEKILDGSKKYEFRKSLFKRQDITKVVIYATMPIGKVVAEFDIEKIIHDEPEKLWRKTRKHAGISKDFFNEYFCGRKNAVAIKVGKITEYEKPMCITMLGKNITPPQSFRYLAA